MNISHNAGCLIGEITKRPEFSCSGVAERRAEGKTMVPATIDYEEEGQASGTEWKKASVADIEGMLSIGQCIILHNC